MQCLGEGVIGAFCGGSRRRNKAADKETHPHSNWCRTELSAFEALRSVRVYGSGVVKGMRAHAWDKVVRAARRGPLECFLRHELTQIPRVAFAMDRRNTTADNTFVLKSKLGLRSVRSRLGGRGLLEIAVASVFSRERPLPPQIRLVPPSAPLVVMPDVFKRQGHRRSHGCSCRGSVFRQAVGPLGNRREV